MSNKKVRNKECYCGSGKRLKKCHLYATWDEKKIIKRIKEPRIIPIPLLEKYLITATIKEQRRKLFQIRIWDDGTLYIDFSYFNNSNGLLTELLIKPNLEHPASISLTDNGKIVSHLVKYTHHTDWRAHFSQDWKILTKVKKTSIPIKNLNWHIFTITLQGFEWFHEATKKEDISSSQKKYVYNYDLTQDWKDFEWVKFVGWWIHKDMLWYNSVWAKPIGMPLAYMKVQDKTLWWFYLSSKAWSGYILFLSCEHVPWLQSSRNPYMTFMWWFDKSEIVDNQEIETSALFLIYPRENDLEQVLENIDYTDL